MKKYPTKIQLRFKDIDKLGHVNNANHLSYLEVARVSFANEVLGDVDWTKEGMILARIDISYKKPIFLEDDVWVEMWVSKIGNKSFDLTYEIINRKNNQVLAQANSVIVCYNYEKDSAIEIPNKWVKLMKEFLSDS